MRASQLKPWSLEKIEKSEAVLAGKSPVAEVLQAN